MTRLTLQKFQIIRSFPFLPQCLLFIIPCHRKKHSQNAKFSRVNSNYLVDLVHIVVKSSEMMFQPLIVQIVFDQRLNFDLPAQKIYNKTKSDENNLKKIYIF